MLVLKSTAEDSSLVENGIRPGAKLLTVNDHDVCDMLDYRFFSADEQLVLLFETTDRQRVELELGLDDLVDLTLEFEPDKPLHCNNKCVFCFIHQLPKGLRRSLYFKDEDYRLSFQHGNYITLTNLTENDFARIAEQKLSPLYISVHSTDDTLRRRMLGNDKIPPLLPQMNRLIDSGIELHTQIVLIPGWNDGEHLQRTVDDLAAMYPGVQSVAVVPVGLTEHRTKLPALEEFTPKQASIAIQELLRIGDNMKTALGIRFVYPADEFFIVADREIPPELFYDGFPQVENGVGMVRQLLDSEPADDTRLDSPVSLTIATGNLVADILRNVLDEKWHSVENLGYTIVPVDNNLLGKTVTVSGLLGGGDIIDALSQSDEIGDIVVVPPDCLNDDGLFLDDLMLSDVSQKLGRPVIQAEYSPVDTLNKTLKEFSN
jgi:putative radical SAM enzyme (TIGR03279 family)